jgi:hypothetical protein
MKPPSEIDWPFRTAFVVLLSAAFLLLLLDS